MGPGFTLTKKMALAASSGVLAFLGIPVIKTILPDKQTKLADDEYLDLPMPTADLTKDIMLPEGIGTSTDIPVDVSHWLLLSLLNSKNISRRERALEELAHQRRWNDAECLEIAQALDHDNTIRLARTYDADLRLFLSPPSAEFLKQSFQSEKAEKIVRTILKEVSENIDTCSHCTNFYTNLSIRYRPDSNVLAMNDLNQVDGIVRARKRSKTSTYNDDLVKLKAVLNNVICGEEQAMSMVKSGILFALLYFRNKYKEDIPINSLLAQILANLSTYSSMRDHLFIDGWIQSLIEYSRSESLELSMPAIKGLANLDLDSVDENGIYGNHIYLLYPHHRQLESHVDCDVIFVHGLVGSVFKSWRQGNVSTDKEEAIELLPVIPVDDSKPKDKSLSSLTKRRSFKDAKSILSHLFETTQQSNLNNIDLDKVSRCWPKDWLAHDVPNIRILAVDYPTALTSWKTECDFNKDTLEQRAKHVTRQLENAKVGSRPIIWVTHSMGGLLVKQILVSCHDAAAKDEVKFKSSINAKSDNNNDQSNSQFCQKIVDQTKGIVFYSVPHRGSNLEWIERTNLQKLLMLTTEVIELQKDSPVLLNLHDKFLKMIEQDNRHKSIKFLSFVETAISSFKVNKVLQWRGILVHEDSLKFEYGPIYKLNVDHAHSSKPSSKTSITYTKTLELIKDILPQNDTECETNKNEYLLPFVSFLI